MKRSAVAVWHGNINDGKGHLSTQSGVLKETDYSFNSRFADGHGTNPEELIAAAHAGCFAMKLSLDLTEKGFKPTSLTVRGEIEMESLVIAASHLTLTAVVPGITQEDFQLLAQGAKDNCPVSRALNLNITLDATLES